MAEADSGKCFSLPSNYVTIVQLQERWLKEKQRKQQAIEKEEKEEKKQNPVPQNHENRIANGSIRSQAPVDENLHKRENHSGKGWREVGLVAKEPQSKEVIITAPVVKDGFDGIREKKKKNCYFRNRKPRVERDGSGDMAKVSITDVAEEEITTVVSVGNGGGESSKVKCKWNGDNKEVEEVATVCMVEVVGESNVDREITGQRNGVGFRGMKNSRGRIGVKVGEVSHKVDSAEQSGKEPNEKKEEVSVDVKERTNEKVTMGGAVLAYGDKEVEKVEGKKRRVWARGKKDNRRKMGVRVGEVSHKVDSAEQSGQEPNEEKEEVSVDVKERTNEKMRVGGAFHAYGDKEVEEVATFCTVKVVKESNVEMEIAGHRSRVEFMGKKNNGRRMGDRVAEVSNKMDSVEQSGKEPNEEKEEVSVDVKERTNEKMRTGAAFRAYGDKEVEKMATVCTVKVVGENEVNREITEQRSRVGFSGKRSSRRMMTYRVKEVRDKTDKADSVEQSGQEQNAEKEEVSVDVKERTNEKVRVTGALRAYGDKSKDVPLIDPEADLRMKIERDLRDLSLSDRRYGRGRSSFGVYGEKWRYGSSRRYEPRKMLKQRHNGFVWIKKGESSNGNVAEIENSG